VRITILQPRTARRIPERPQQLQLLTWRRMKMMWFIGSAYARYAKKRDARSYVPVVLFYALGLMLKPMLVWLRGQAPADRYTYYTADRPLRHHRLGIWRPHSTDRGPLQASGWSVQLRRAVDGNACCNRDSSFLHLHPSAVNRVYLENDDFHKSCGVIVGRNE